MHFNFKKKLFLNVTGKRSCCCIVCMISSLLEERGKYWFEVSLGYIVRMCLKKRRERERDRQTDRQTETERNRETEKDRDRWQRWRQRKILKNNICSVSFISCPRNFMLLTCSKYAFINYNQILYRKEVTQDKTGKTILGVYSKLIDLYLKLHFKK